MTDLLKPPGESKVDAAAPTSLSFSFTQSAVRAQAPVRVEATARAAGKVILVGEHAVVYGARAIALPLLSKNVHLRLYTDRVSTSSPHIKFHIAGKPAHESLVQMVLEAFTVLRIPKFNVSIDAHTTLMFGAGVGSSASLCVSVLRGLSQICDITLSPMEISHLANKLEKRFHGNPSGLDTSVVALEQPLLFEKDRPPEALTIHRPNGSHLPWCFALLDTGVRSPTIHMVHKAEPWFKANTDQAIRDFNELTASAAKALQDGDFELLGDVISSTHGKLIETGIVTSPVEAVVTKALKHGAAAAKVTGAGGGGCVLALFSPTKCDRALASLRTELGNDRVHPFFIP